MLIWEIKTSVDRFFSIHMEISKKCEIKFYRLNLCFWENHRKIRNQEISKFNFSKANFYIKENVCLFLSLELSPINNLFLSNRKLVLIVFEKISNLI